MAAEPPSTPGRATVLVRRRLIDMVRRWWGGSAHCTGCGADDSEGTLRHRRCRHCGREWQMRGGHRARAEHVSLDDTYAVASGGDTAEQAITRTTLGVVPEPLERLSGGQQEALLAEARGETLAEVCRRLGVTESRVCQLRASAGARVACYDSHNKTD